MTPAERRPETAAAAGAAPDSTLNESWQARAETERGAIKRAPKRHSVGAIDFRRLAVWAHALDYVERGEEGSSREYRRVADPPPFDPRPGNEFGIGVEAKPGVG